MITAEQIPGQAAKAVYDLFELGYLESIGLHPESIVAAALNAWPRARQDYDLGEWSMCLPLSQKEEQ